MTFTHDFHTISHYASSQCFRHLTIISAGGVYQEQVVESYYSFVVDIGELQSMFFVEGRPLNCKIATVLSQINDSREKKILRAVPRTLKM